MASNDAEEFMNDALDDEAEKKVIEADKKMTEYFRRVFTSKDGRIVLQQILTDLKFFDECIDEQDRVLNNYAKFMIFKRLKVDNKSKITNLLMEIN
ncbi:MAG: hypothetical protein J6S67_12375 [Methanobrevibacter sp.]|nr:hypothetical protein [Methanobrevibacter sp.]